MNMIRYGKREEYEIVNKIAKQGQEYHYRLRPDIYILDSTENKLLPISKFYEMVEMRNIIVYESDNRVMAYMAFKDKEIDNPLMKKTKILFIDSIAVDEKYRNRGIATELIKWIKEYAKQNEYEKVELQVNGKNEEALKLYNKEMFKIKSINMELFV